MMIPPFTWKVKNPRNLPGLERALFGLGQLDLALTELIRKGQDHPVCYDAWAIRHQVSWCEAILGGLAVMPNLEQFAAAFHARISTLPPNPQDPPGLEGAIVAIHEIISGLNELLEQRPRNEDEASLIQDGWAVRYALRVHLGTLDAECSTPPELRAIVRGYIEGDEFFHQENDFWPTWENTEEAPTAPLAN